VISADRVLRDAAEEPTLQLMRHIDRLSADPSPPARRKRLLVATVLAAPATVFVGTHVIQYGIGITGAADWIDAPFGDRRVAWLAIGLVLGGPVIAFTLAATRLLSIRPMRHGDDLELRIRVRLDLWALVVATVSAGVGGFLIAHIALENLLDVVGAIPSS
jgi:hypothetical protein